MNIGDKISTSSPIQLIRQRFLSIFAMCSMKDVAPMSNIKIIINFQIVDEKKKLRYVNVVSWVGR